MNGSPTLVAGPAQRQILSPLKPNQMKIYRNGLSGGSAKNSTPKRSLACDENENPKRVKAPLASKSTMQTRMQKRLFNALSDVTNTTAPSAPPSTTKIAVPSGKTLLKPTTPSPTTCPKTPTKKSTPRPKTSPPRTSNLRPRTRATSPTLRPSGISKRACKPSSLRHSITPADAPVEISPAIPDSWNFEIYEDTPQETLQNLVEHSTQILDLSDVSDAESDLSELAEKGKENIHPTRLAELLAYSPEERGSAMYIDSDSRIPQRRRSARRSVRARRPVLREMKKEEILELEELPETVEQQSPCAGSSAKVPKLDAKEFMVFKTPEKSKTPSAPSSPDWAIWASDGASEDGDEVVLPKTPRKLFADFERIGGKFSIFEDPLSSSPRSSGSEN